MKRSTNITVLTMVLFLMASCTQAVRRPEVVEQTAIKGIFREVADGLAEAGKVDLIVRLSLKTHLTNYYLLQSKTSLHGRAGYPFIVTIDGQSSLWREEGQIEHTPEYDAKGIRTPEGGNGRRYVLEKRLRLAPGSHLVEIDLPEESVVYRVNVTLEERSAPYLLEFKPMYRRSGKQRSSYLRGVGWLEPFLDNKPLNRTATEPNKTGETR